MPSKPKLNLKLFNYYLQDPRVLRDAILPHEAKFEIILNNFFQLKYKKALSLQTI